MTRETECGIAAAVGGVAPSIIALAVQLVTNEKAKIPSRFEYWLGLALFAMIGYFVARAFRERVPKTAFFLGVGLPAMFQVGTAAIYKPGAPEIVQPSATVAATTVTWFWSFSTAYAQGPPPQEEPAPSTSVPAASTQYLLLNFSSVPSDTRLVFRTSDGKTRTIPVNWADAVRTGTVRVRVPENTEEFTLVSTLARNSPTIKLEDQPRQIFQLRTETDSISAFMKALGFKATDELKVTAQPTAASSPPQTP
jgi:hypothetical protein